MIVRPVRLFGRSVSGFSLPACAIGLGLLSASALVPPAMAQEITRHGGTMRTKPASKTANVAPKAEDIQVRAGIRTADGVTNTTPGGGLLPPETASKSQQSVTRDFIAKQAPTSNALSLIQYIPGVTLSNGDAFGQSDQGGLYIRGLSQTSVGYTFNGLPAADPGSYAPFTSSAVDTENVGKITVQQGVSDISSPVYNSVAGAVQEFMSDPLDHFGGRFDGSYGNHQLAREFLRLDSGLFGHSGVKAFASYSYGTNAQWLGPGRDRRSHVDSEVMKEWGDGNSAKVFLTYTQQSFPFLMSVTKSTFDKYGRSAAYYDPTYTPGDVNFYQLNSEQRHSVIIGAPVSLNLGHGLTFTTEPYWMHFHGAGNDGQDQNEYGYNGTQPTGNLNIPGNMDGQAAILAVDDFNQTVTGFNNTLSWKSGHNELQAGYWYQYYNHEEKAPFEPLGTNGLPANFWGQSPILTQTGAPIMQFNIHLVEQTNALFLSDTYKMLNDKLTVNAGFKFVMLSYHSTNLIPGDNYNYGRSDAEPLPQISASYQLTKHDQIYLDAATAFREPGGILVYGNLWDANSPSVDEEHATNLKAEYSISEELGWRHTGLVNVSASVFNYNMSNRQSSTSQYFGGRLISTYINAGGQTSRGVQVALGLKPWHYFSPYVSFQYLHATLDNNLGNGTDYIPSAGKIAIYSPKYTANAGLSYDNGHIFANGYMSYVSSQYSTFMDNATLPAYAIGNVTAGYRFHKIGFLKYPQIQVNAQNVTDNKYLASGGGGFTAKTIRGIYGNTIKGSQPLYTVGGGFGLVISVSSGF